MEQIEKQMAAHGKVLLHGGQVKVGDVGRGKEGKLRDGIRKAEVCVLELG